MNDDNAARRELVRVLASLTQDELTAVLNESRGQSDPTGLPDVGTLLRSMLPTQTDVRADLVAALNATPQENR